MPNEPVETVVPAVPWDKTPMAYTVVPARDEDGNLIEPASKPADAKSGAAAESKEK